jgi:diguanylate cyclase (GGDEF)-like protein/PAS domain S-box-containing protein
MNTDSTDQSPGILLIEDEALIAREIKTRLTQMGHRVVGVAHSAAQALEIARTIEPDLLLTDINLGSKMDGVDVAREITAIRDIPVIFLTAYSDEETVARAKSLAPYGYIIKPVENRELQIAIDMAIYKFNIEKELRETKQLLTTALQCIGDALVFVGQNGKISNLNEAAESLFGWTKKEAVGVDWDDFLRLENPQAPGSTRSFIERAINTEAVTRLSPFLAHRRSGMQVLIDGITGPIETGGEKSGAVLILRELAELRDPVENLPEPSELLDMGLPDSEYSFVLLLISPDNIGQVNSDLGRDAGDQVMQKIASQLNKSLRSTDLASLYAGAIFCANLPYTSLDEGKKIAETVLNDLSEQTFLNGTVSLEFSIGVAHCDPHDLQNSPLELFRRANWALNVAKESGGKKVVIWRPNVEIELVGNLDRRSGMFSSDVSRDYRNMLLLWNTMNIVGKSANLAEWRDRLLSHLRISFELDTVALIAWEDESVRVLANKTDDAVDREFPDLPPEHEKLISEMFRSPQQPQVRFIESLENSTYFIPVSREKIFRMLYLVSSRDVREKDLSFIKTLADYFSGSLESGLNSSYNVKEVADEIVDGQIVYKSLQMESLLEHIRLVAPTDATVLISGESGTGKELLAKTIHAQSPRSEQPMITVDCGAVVESLIESELFGHVKGAFTGAQKASPGRLKEAHGGTVFLDEIGELSLDLQVKLLRFVQDKQFVAVGGTQYETVDTRVIAATNRDLKELVRQGRFREDLYYRLNVFTVQSPPLRDRPEDILLLARHYLRLNSEKYEKQITGFTPDAEIALQEYAWPGNIRELINIMIRSVILCQNDQISTIHLGLFPEKSTLEVAGASKESPDNTQTVPGQGSQVTESVEVNLAKEFNALIRTCLDKGYTHPLGRWLEEDLILASLEVSGQVAYRAAEALSMPESTIRRKIIRIKKQYPSAVPDRPDEWLDILPLLRRIIPVARTRGVPPIDLSTQLLVVQIRAITSNISRGAGLIGVSVPTFRRLLNDLD